MRVFILLIVLGAVTIPAGAQPHQVFGYAGVLGEWELTANVTGNASYGQQDFFGSLTLKHVGICSVDGPEEKTGEIHLRISESRMRAILLIDGVACSYRGRLANFYNGTMNCPGRPEVPLKVWVK